MEVHLSPDLEAKLTDSAARQGRNPDALVQDMIAKYFEEEARSIEGGRRGDSALERWEHQSHSQAGERLKRFLK